MACVWQLGEFTLQYVRFRTNLNSCGAARIAAGHSRSGRAYSSLSYFMKNLRDEGLIFNPQFLCLLLDTFQVIAIDSDIQDRVFFLCSIAATISSYSRPRTGTNSSTKLTDALANSLIFNQL